MSRTDIIDQSQMVGTPEPIPPEHPYKNEVFARVLTSKNGVGKPCVTPIQLQGMADLLAEKPLETVSVKDENGLPVEQLIDYTTGATTGAHLVDNTAPDRVLAIMRPLKSDDPHEPGIVVRLSYEIEGIKAATAALKGSVSIAPDAIQDLDREEQRVKAWLDMIAQFESMMFPQ